MPRPNGTCPDCGQPVLTALTAAGRRQALNPQPDDRGNTAAYRDGTGTWRARVPTPELPILPYEHLHMPHPATCDRHLAQTRGAPPAGRTGTAQNRTNVTSLTSYRRHRRTPR